MKSSFEGKRLIFTISPGRSGTGYLSKLLGCLPGVASFHEPEPKFSNWMRIVQKSPYRALEFWLQEKLPAIRRNPEPVYVETSHLFCKGFIESLVDLGITPDVIVLRRPHRLVASSLFALGTIPGRTRDGLKFCVGPDDPQVLPLPGWESLHDYQLCFWYCLELSRRTKFYESFFSNLGCSIATTSLDEIATLEGIRHLVEGLGLAVLSDGSARYLFGNIMEEKVNTKSEMKADRGLTGQQLDELESQVLDLLRSKMQVRR